MKLTLAIIFLVALLAACSSPYRDVAGTSLDASSVFTAFTSAGDVAIVDAAFAPNHLVRVSNSNVTERRSIVIYGLNVSGGRDSETVVFNATNSSSKNWSRIEKIVLNGTASGTITIESNVTRDDIAIITPGLLTAYNAEVYNGTNYITPGLIFNSSDIDVHLATEYVLYQSCDTNQSGPNMSVTYYVSPDAVKWFPGAVTPQTCSNAAYKTTLTDAGVQYLRLQISGGDTIPNRQYIKLVYR